MLVLLPVFARYLYLVKWGQGKNQKLIDNINLIDHFLTREILVRADMRKVFEFFSNAQNLELITPKELNFKILSPIPIEMKNGTLIDYRIRLFGISFNWKTLISAWEPERRFVDEQLKGPYSKWIHTHSFETKEDGIMIKDEVRYRLPFFPLGELMFLAVRHQLNRIFDYRTTRIKEIFQEENQKKPLDSMTPVK